MPTGFDFNQLMQDPMFQIGLGMLAQPRSWQNRGLAGMAQGAMQGIGNLQQVQQFQRQQQESAQMQQIRAATLANQAAEEERKQALVASRNALVQRLRGTAPQPRPFAFKPQEGDAEVMKDFNEINFAADAIAAGASPDAYLARVMQLDEKKAAREQRAAEKEEQRILEEKRHNDILAERRLTREGLEASRNATLAQAKALHALASGNVRPVEVFDPATGQINLVHPSQSYGKQAPPKAVSLTNEDKRKSAVAALDFADKELRTLETMITANPRSVGPGGAVARVWETAKGIAAPESSTPSLDIRNQQLNIIASIRKRLTDANASNRDIAQTLEIIGGGLMGTAGASKRSITTLREQLKSQRESLHRAAPPGAAPAADAVKVGDIKKGKDGRNYRVLSIKADGTPDDVELVK